MPASERKNNFFVIAVGVSAGNLDALERLLSGVDNLTDNSFVIITHLNSEYKNIYDEITSKYSFLKVVKIQHYMAVEPGIIYIAPSDGIVQIENNLFTIKPLISAKNNSLYYPVDNFLISLAESYENSAVAIILSGNGNDGSLGIEAIKEKFGLVIAQDPSTARQPSMPDSVISSGLADYILAPENMAPVLFKYINDLNRSDYHLEINDERLNEIYDILNSSFGHDFSSYKKNTTIRRILRQIYINNLNCVEDYIELIKNADYKRKFLFKEFLIGVTKFFRDDEVFSLIENKIVPDVIENAKNAGNIVRIWVAACSTGEEAYSIAILLKEYISKNAPEVNFKIFATDINYKSLNYARNGIYSEKSLYNIKSEIKEAYFCRCTQGYKVKKELRDCIIFTEHNLLKDPPFSKIDFMSCRNLLIYLNHEAQIKASSIFYYSLKPGGYLVLGNVETPGTLTGQFIEIDKKYKIYRCKNEKIPTNFITRFDFKGAGKKKERISEINYESSGMKIKELTEKILLNEYSPVTLIINAEDDIVYTSGRAGRYFEPSCGEASLNIFQMAKEGIKMQLVMAIKDCRDNKKNRKFIENIDFKINDHIEKVNILIREFDKKYAGYLMILIEPRQYTARGIFEPAVSGITEEAGSKDDYIKELEDDLNNMHHYLKEISDELNSSTEQLKLINEELLSSNEELQSSNEELETSKEELQSINQELMSVNNELNNKNDELIKIHDDLNNLFNSINIGVLFLDNEYRIRKFTTCISNIINVIPSDIGRPLNHIANNIESGFNIFETLDKVKNEKIIEEYEIKTVNGQYYLARLFPYLTLNYNYDGFIVTFVNISELKKAGEAIKMSETRYHELFNGSRQGIAVYEAYNDGEDFIFKDFNKSAEKLEKLNKSDVIGRKVSEVFPGAIKSGIVDMFRKVYESGASQFFPAALYENGSQKSWRENYIYKLYSGEIVALYDDVSERKKFEEDIIAARQQAEKANLAKSQFLANMSHELRTPMNGIIGFTDLLEETELNVRQKDFIDIIKNSSLHLLEIIDDILDLSKIESGKIKLNIEKTDLKEIVINTIKVIAPQCEAKGLNIKCEVFDAFDYFILADKLRLKQILTNLITNSIKFTHTGYIKVSLNEIKNDGSTVVIKISISDTGIGIEKNKINDIFERFHQLENYSTKHYAGAGLGLSIVKGLVEMIGGNISVESEPGKGSVFSVEAPFKITARAVEITKDQAARPEINDEILNKIKNIKVLVVEDDKTSQKLIGIIAQNYGWQMDIVDTGTAAIDHYKNRTYDLILMDGQLPELSGFEATRIIRRIEAGKNIEKTLIMAMTAYASETDRANFVNAGVDEYISKPIDIDEFLLKISKLI